PPIAGGCAALNPGKASKWERLACGSKLGYICRKGNSTTITPSVVPTDELWIGLNDQKTQNLFEWSDRSYVTFAKWLVGEPSHTAIPREHCVVMKGKGWIRFSSYCYSNAVEAKTFNEAETACGQSAANLVQVADRYENAFLISQFGLQPEKYYWIGLSNTERVETFEWTNKQTVEFTHFNVGTPGMVMNGGQHGLALMCWIITLALSGQSLSELHQTMRTGKMDSLIMYFLDSIVQKSTYTIIICGMMLIVNSTMIGSVRYDWTDGRYRWIDNWFLNYTKWAVGEPQRDQACVYIDSDGTWKTSACSKSYYSLCKRSP
ncbi:macrophage mannose receptor 1 isoform X2, partial [Clarias magur]